ncbi:hypothetical protein KDK_56330 [Dictyobacter kobayashii]|uniref:PAS domain-containing protein n=2 Tax=Dictyobacter kobayashii TaxID=2014872 RepID=A0A402AS03_9CHLR|nr:hypothetical protein KDK_56330 [Dictyobacter kobayashii]
MNVRQMLTGNMQNVVYEMGYARPDGHMLWLKVTRSLVWHPQGFPLYFFSWIEDLTLQQRCEQERDVLLACEQAARTAAQQAVEQTQSLSTMLQAIFKNVADGIVVYDRDGVVLHINAAARTLLELGQEADCLGKTYADLFEGYKRYDEAMELIPWKSFPSHPCCRRSRSRSLAFLICACIFLPDMNAI